MYSDSFSSSECSFKLIIYKTPRIALTKLDVLDQLAEIKIAIGYSYKGAKLDSFPGKTTNSYFFLNAK